MLSYNIGLSAIRANQQALQTISNNIANASTEGYHRQRANLTPTAPYLIDGKQFGTGVQVASIERLRNASVANSLTLNNSQRSAAQTELAALEQIERLLSPSSGSLHTRLTDFFNGIEKLAANPAEDIQRREVLAAAQGIAGELSTIHAGLDRLQSDLSQQAREVVGRINQLASDLADVNTSIRTAQAAGAQPATLLDHRDRLINELASLVDISPETLANEQSPLVAAGGWLVLNEAPQSLSLIQGADGGLELRLGTSLGPVIPVSGELAALLTAVNETMPDARQSLLDWTGAFVGMVDTVQATGLGLSGPFTQLTGSRSLNSLTAPLKNAGLVLPVSSGSLYVTLTNSATGARETTRIDIDPRVDSLQDVLNRLDAIGHLQAGVDGAGRVQLVADSGWAFDFAGRLDPTVDLSGVTGTAAPTLTGSFTGPGNADWTVTVIGSGEVGVTDGLKFRITDSSGALVKELNVGQGAAAWQPIEIAKGVSITLSPGTLAAGDTFSIQLVSEPDTSGILAALGVNSFFETNDLRTISVSNALLSDPGRLSASRTGAAGDAGQLARLIAKREQPLAALGQDTIEGRLASLTARSGLAVTQRRTALTQLGAQYDQLRNQQDALSGVDPNEELLLMLEFQRAFQANAKFLSTVNEMLDEILSLVR